MFGLLKQPTARLSRTTEMLVKQRHRTGNSQANRHVKILSCAAKSCPPGETYINDPRRRPIRRDPIRYRMTPIVMRSYECSDRFENGRIFLPVDAPGSMTISSSSSASRAQNTTTRSIQPLTPRIICGGRCLGDLPRRSVDSASFSIGALAQKCHPPLEAAPPSSAPGRRIAEVTGSNRLSSTTKSAQIDVISSATE
jgi:hypothetical protein